jgi:hypothetical protein
MKVVPLYDPQYAPHDGDLIVLEPSRRFFETQRYFDTLGSSGMSHSQVRVGPVLASTIYQFDYSAQARRSLEEYPTLTQLHAAPPRFESDVQELDSMKTSGDPFAQTPRRRSQ